jgi:putative endonuclease
MKLYWCYIMSNKSQKLYVGFTNDLVGRVIEHKEKLYPRSFTARYVFDTLVVGIRDVDTKTRIGD